MSTVMERKRTSSAPTIEKLAGLIEWVIEAPIEEVCWRITELGSMREWLTAQKSATDLRIRAVRLELIALRKVATGGLAGKIPGNGQLKASAVWMASLTDDEFATVLSEIDGEKTPISLYRADRQQREAMAAALRGREDSPDMNSRGSAHAEAENDRRSRSAATTLLGDIIRDGESFTIAEAAERLADRLDIDVETRAETAEGLREMVRSAIRKGDRSVPVDSWSVLPVAFTVQHSDGTYMRVPASSATVAHLVAHEHEVRSRAQAAMDHADHLRDLLVHISLELGNTPEIEDLDESHMSDHLAPIVNRIRREANFTARAEGDQSLAA